jgi:hypothetical protein
MYPYYELQEADGIFTAVLPSFHDYTWPDIVSPSGFVWIANPVIDLSGKLDSIVSNCMFGTSDVDLKCSTQRVELDISIPAVDFLRITRTTFARGIDLIHSDKHQPVGFRLWSLPRAKWHNVMMQNQIRLILHRPDGGEPALLTSTNRELLLSIVDKVSRTSRDG